jgi:DNA-binding transcriptional LysR family regulator
MDRLKAMETFVRVVREGSFAAAASQLGLSRAIVTKHVMQLEKQLGVRLINRTTRRSSVTDIGQSYFDFCVRVLAEMAEQDALVARLQEEPRGELKVLAPKSFGSLYLGNIVAEFIALYPEIRVSLMLSDVSLHALDLVEHGFDLAVRLHSASDSSLVTRRIGTFHSLLCASPAYLAAHGEPATLEDLSHHKCLLHTRNADGVWHLENAEGESPVKVTGAMTTNSVMVLRQVARNGMGIALLPTYCIGPDLARGVLRRTLGAYTSRQEPIYVMFPHRHLMAAKVRLLIDFLAARISASPWDVPGDIGVAEAQRPDGAITSPPATPIHAVAATATPRAPRRIGGPGKGRRKTARRMRGA